MGSEAITQGEIKAALETMIAVAGAIRDLGQVREGELYARLCGHMSLTAYDAMIRQILKTGLVAREDDGPTLVWVG
jgi:hypothetical protein